MAVFDCFTRPFSRVPRIKVFLFGFAICRKPRKALAQVYLFIKTRIHSLSPRYVFFVRLKDFTPRLNQPKKRRGMTHEEYDPTP